jgi:multidrug transporter EmrE-like cation transporter
MNPLSWLLLGICVLLNAAAQLLLKAGARQLGEINLSVHNIIPMGFKLAFEPHIFAGLACYVLSVILWIVVLSRVEVSVAYPLTSFGYILTALASWWLFGESLSMERVMGIGVIMFGVFLITRSQ